MKSSLYRDMRMLLFFDLPTKTAKDRANYAKFRKFLISEGYIMVQYSVYSRFCRNYAAINKHKQRLEKNKPKHGEVRYIVITDKQYNSMTIFNGDFTLHERTISSDPLIEL